MFTWGGLGGGGFTVSDDYNPWVRDIPKMWGLDSGTNQTPYFGNATRAFFTYM